MTAGAEEGILARRLEGLNDPEGERLPTALPDVVDAHVHLFPDGLFRALWKWFDAHAWPVRYALYAEQVIHFQLSRGVKRIVALHYAHKAGMAREMNAFVLGLAAKHPAVIPLATVFPGEEASGAILREAFAAGAKGVKLHSHVQCVAIDDPRMEPVFAACLEAGVPLVMHAGREPKSPAYSCDPYEICGAARVEHVLKSWPKLKLCVPHLGVDEYVPYQKLLERYDNLWLDTTMTLGGFLSGDVPWHMLSVRPERIMYGTDFPNIPYAWDREVKALAAHGLRDDVLGGILGANALTLFGG
jgi:uncharacterized protein